jgi:single-stranded-DNA-specific exonuclease
MSVAIAQLDGFRAAFAAEAARQLGAVRPSTAVAVDAEVTLRDLDIGFAEELERLAPFGVANRQPLFALAGVTARTTRIVGKGHLQLTLDHGGTTGEAIAFGFAEADPGAGACVNLVATAELDTFRGTPRARLKVSHLARAD